MTPDADGRDHRSVVLRCKDWKSSAPPVSHHEECAPSRRQEALNRPTEGHIGAASLTAGPVQFLARQRPSTFSRSGGGARGTARNLDRDSRHLASGRTQDRRRRSQARIAERTPSAMRRGRSPMPRTSSSLPRGSTSTTLVPATTGTSSRVRPRRTHVQRRKQRRVADPGDLLAAADRGSDPRLRAEDPVDRGVDVRAPPPRRRRRRRTPSRAAWSRAAAHRGGPRRSPR
jgi:hypothetical protein